VLRVAVATLCHCVLILCILYIVLTFFLCNTALYIILYIEDEEDPEAALAALAAAAAGYLHADSAFYAG
jgi:hypothetical protein